MCGICLLVINVFNLILSEKVFMSSLFLKDIFAVYEILGCEGFCVQHFEDVASLSSHLFCFEQENFHNPYPPSSLHSMSFPPGCVEDFSLYRVLSNLIAMYVSVVSFMFILLRNF